MKTDRELIELAAKAAGITLMWSRVPGRPPRLAGTLAAWNPLTDDGDALRLAAKLYLWEAVRLAHREVTAGTDIYAATRRAIVRAAAAIGEAMP